jgi:hypothetical protein
LLRQLQPLPPPDVVLVAFAPIRLFIVKKTPDLPFGPFKEQSPGSLICLETAVPLSATTAKIELAQRLGEPSGKATLPALEV